MIHLLFSFEAIHLSANMKRGYSLGVGKDLFGDWYVVSTWGRKGRTGQSKYVFVASPQEILQKVTSICKKRLNATSRLGCNYVCTSHPLSIRL